MSTLGVKIQSNGSHLVGRMWLAKGDAPRPTVLLLHGIPGIDQNHDLAFALKHAGWNSLIMHYRGCWGSQGTYSLHHILPDVDAMLNFLLTDDDVNSDKVVVCGHSLGGWAAVVAGARHPDIAGVISLAGVNDWKQMGLTEEVVEPSMARFLNGVSASQIVQESYKLEVASHVVTELNGRPLLIVHGDSDSAVAISHSYELQKQYPDSTTLHTVTGADHGFAWERDELIQAVLKWLDQFRPKP